MQNKIKKLSYNINVFDPIISNSKKKNRTNELVKTRQIHFSNKVFNKLFLHEHEQTIIYTYNINYNYFNV